MSYETKKYYYKYCNLARLYNSDFSTISPSCLGGGGGFSSSRSSGRKDATIADAENKRAQIIITNLAAEHWLSILVAVGAMHATSLPFS